MSTVPRFILLVPYRNRYAQFEFFRRHMREVVLADVQEPYEMWFIHQADERPFNRGAMKNLGFWFVRQRYPEHYRDIVLVFHDIDTLASRAGIFDFPTEPGVVKHFYGFEHVLGGIFSIRGGDFERSGGFPNYWTWGYEDNMIHRRVLAANCVVDRSQFRPILDMFVLHLNNDGQIRECNADDARRYVQHHDGDTLHDLHNIRWIAKAPMLHVYHFDTLYPPPATTVEVNLRKDPNLHKLIAQSKP